MFKPALVLSALGLLALPAMAQDGTVATQHRTTSGVQTPAPAKRDAGAVANTPGSAWKRRRYPDLVFSADFPLDPRRRTARRGPARPASPWSSPRWRTAPTS